MRHLRSISVVLVLVGLTTMLGAAFLALGPTWLLSGLLLTWAGLVKVIVVALWRGVANPETAVPAGTDQRPRTGA
jgi:hypothetical protein